MAAETQWAEAYDLPGPGVRMRWLQHSKEIRAYRITGSGMEILSPLYTSLAASGKKRKDA